MDGSQLGMPRRWCVAICEPKRERIARDQFKDAGVEAFLPMRELAPTAERKINVQPLWSGYLFVGSTSIPQTVRAAPRMIATSDGSPIFVPRGVVETLMAQCDADGLMEKYEAPEVYRPNIGQTVRLLYGPLAGQFGIIAEVCKARVKLELSCAIGKVRVSVLSEQVAPVAV